MDFSLLSHLGTMINNRAARRAVELEGLDERLLRDIGFSADGRPLNPETGLPVGKARSGFIERLSPAMLLMTMH